MTFVEFRHTEELPYLDKEHLPKNQDNILTGERPNAFL